ncbi:uncharacterized protein LOC102810396 [Saccoglossus kowalevskii]
MALPIVDGKVGMTLVKQVFPETSGLTYHDPGDKVGTVMILEDGKFCEPPGGWNKSGRTYLVLKEKKKSTERVKELLKSIRKKKNKSKCTCQSKHNKVASVNKVENIQSSIARKKSARI